MTVEDKDKSGLSVAELIKDILRYKRGNNKMTSDPRNVEEVESSVVLTPEQIERNETILGELQKADEAFAADTRKLGNHIKTRDRRTGRFSKSWPNQDKKDLL